MFLFPNGGISESVKGCLHRRFVASNSACFGMNPMAFGRGGDGKTLNPAVSLYSSLFSTFLSLSLPLRLLPFFIFGNISFSWVRPVTLAEPCFLLIFLLLATERKTAIEFSLHSKCFPLILFSRSKPRRLHAPFTGQNARYDATTFLTSILIWSAAVLVPLIDDPRVDWYVCRLHFKCAFCYFSPTF